MGYSGSGAQMVKFNKKQLSKRERYFDKKVRNDKVYTKFVDYKKMSPATFASFKQRKREDAVRLHRKQWTTLIIIMGFIVSGIIYLLFFV